MPDGGTDLSVRQAGYGSQFAADSSGDQTAVMAVTQRPVTEAALNEGSDRPAWRTIPSRFLCGSADKNIPVAAHGFHGSTSGLAADGGAGGGRTLWPSRKHPSSWTSSVRQRAQRRECEPPLLGGSPRTLLWAEALPFSGKRWGRSLLPGGGRSVPQKRVLCEVPWVSLHTRFRRWVAHAAVRPGCCRPRGPEQMRPGTSIGWCRSTPASSCVMPSAQARPIRCDCSAAERCEA